MTTVSLTRLSRREGTTLITGVAQGRALPDEVTNQILVRTDGVPLFIEELTKAVLESGLLRKREHDYVLDGPLASVAIPATLQDSLMARLDRLSSVREVAQVGAALGRQFSHELLQAAAGMPERQLSDALEQLVRAELLFRRGAPPNAQYTFKHALVQDVACQSASGQPPATACSDRKSVRDPFSGSRTRPTRACRPPLHRGWAN